MIKDVLIYGVSIVGGWLLVGACMFIMRRTVEIEGKSFKWIDFWLGGTERAVAMILVVKAPGYLPAFIGGWIALKFAANWKRREASDDQMIRRSSLLFLIGSVLSFAIATIAGLMIRPQALSVWDPPNQIH